MSAVADRATQTTLSAGGSPLPRPLHLSPSPPLPSLTEPLGDHYESPGWEVWLPRFDEVLHGDCSHGIDAGGRGAAGGEGGHRPHQGTAAPLPPTCWGRPQLLRTSDFPGPHPPKGRGMDDRMPQERKRCPLPHHPHPQT